VPQKPSQDPVQKVRAFLNRPTVAKPRTVKTLRSSIRSLLGAQASEEAVNGVFENLERLKVFEISDGKVTYLA